MKKQYDDIHQEKPYFWNYIVITVIQANVLSYREKEQKRHPFLISIKDLGDHLIVF